MSNLPSIGYQFQSPQFGSSQREATSGKRYNKEKALEGYLSSQIPAMREAKRYQGLLSQRQAEQEALSQQHKESMALEERALQQREKARKREEKYAKIGLGLQGLGLLSQGLQAWEPWKKDKTGGSGFAPQEYGSGTYGSGGYDATGWNIGGSSGGGDGGGVTVTWTGTF